MSKNLAERMLNKSLNIKVYADPGLLISEIFPIEIQKKRFNLGIIAHYVDQQYLEDEKEHLEKLNVTVIRIDQSPYEVSKQICECKCVLSSSLHGLIFADSYNVPNHQLIFLNKKNNYTSNVLGNNFKFKDYYSSFDLEYKEPFVFEKIQFDDNNIQKIMYQIISEYSINPSEVKHKQRELVNSMIFARRKK